MDLINEKFHQQGKEKEQTNIKISCFLSIKNLHNVFHIRQYFCTTKCHHISCLPTISQLTKGEIRFTMGIQ